MSINFEINRKQSILFSSLITSCKNTVDNIEVLSCNPKTFHEFAQWLRFEAASKNDFRVVNLFVFYGWRNLESSYQRSIMVHTMLEVYPAFRQIGSSMSILNHNEHLDILTRFTLNDKYLVFDAKNVIVNLVDSCQLN